MQPYRLIGVIFVLLLLVSGLCRAEKISGVSVRMAKVDDDAPLAFPERGDIVKKKDGEVVLRVGGKPDVSISPEYAVALEPFFTEHSKALWVDQVTEQKGEYTGISGPYQWSGSLDVSLGAGGMVDEISTHLNGVEEVIEYGGKKDVPHIPNATGLIDIKAVSKRMHLREGVNAPFPVSVKTGERAVKGLLFPPLSDTSSTYELVFQTRGPDGPETEHLSVNGDAVDQALKRGGSRSPIQFEFSKGVSIPKGKKKATAKMSVAAGGKIKTGEFQFSRWVPPTDLSCNYDDFLKAEK